MDNYKLGKLIKEKENAMGVNSKILNNFLHNVDEVHIKKYKNGVKMLSDCISRHGIEFEVEEDAVINWNEILRGYFTNEKEC